MSGPADNLASGAARLRALHDAKARAEIAAANALAPGSDAIGFGGTLQPSVVLLKGLPGPAEAAGDAALSGADGEAARKALERLGYDPAAAFYALTRPATGTADEARAARVRALVEAVDAGVVIGLDAEAGEDLGAAFGLGRLAFGREYRAGGRRIVVVEGLEASLNDDKLKARVWRQLQAAAPAGPVY